LDGKVVVGEVVVGEGVVGEGVEGEGVEGKVVVGERMCSRTECSSVLYSMLSLCRVEETKKRKSRRDLLREEVVVCVRKSSGRTATFVSTKKARTFH
jgi:hypothetical protein